MPPSPDRRPAPPAFTSAPENADLFFRRLMESLPDHVYFKDTEGRFLAMSHAQARRFGLASPDEAIGRSDYDFFPSELAALKDADEREIIRTGVGITDFEERNTLPGGQNQWVLTTKLPLAGHDGRIIGTFGLSHDITAEREAKKQLEAQHRLLGTLIEILPCRIFVKDREGRIRLTNEAYRRAFGLGPPELINGKRLDEMLQGERSRQAAVDDRAVLETGALILNREQRDDTVADQPEWGLLSKVPLRDPDGNIDGIVGMLADITAQKQAEERAIQARRELEEKNRQMETELSLACDLQTELMTASVNHVLAMIAPDQPRTRLVFHYEPCEHLAGDFLHAVPISADRFGLLLCDVMGHGVKAALVTTLIRGLLADPSVRERAPHEILASLNDRLCGLLGRPPMPRFVTAVYAVTDLARHQVLLANAGHPWPLWQAAEAPPRDFSAAECGPALGLIPGAVYSTIEQPLTTGHRLILFTDGWTEEMNADDEEYGRERLRAALARHAALEPAATLRTIAAEMHAHSGRAACSDDLCATIVQV